MVKLLNLVRPTRAYFGQKDALQCVVIQRTVHDLNIQTQIIIGDTVRESDGLALSSRNAYLTETERLAAPILYQGLCAAEKLYQQHKRSKSPLTPSQLQQAVKDVLLQEPLVSEIQYISIDHRGTMEPLPSDQPMDMVGNDEQHEWEKGAIVSLACKIGTVRLIDNMVLK